MIGASPAKAGRGGLAKGAPGAKRVAPAILMPIARRAAPKCENEVQK